jgi:hypothetical protein
MTILVLYYIKLDSQIIVNNTKVAASFGHENELHRWKCPMSILTD